MRRCLLPTALALLLPACLTPRTIDSPPFPKEKMEVFGAVLEVLERQGFRVQSVMNQSEIEAVQIQLSPFNRQGTRRTATISLEAAPTGTVVHLMVVKELNCNITNPLDEALADWGREDFDTEIEELLMALIGMKVMPPRMPAPPPARKR